jgi:hypothetical protein
MKTLKGQGEGLGIVIIGAIVLVVLILYMVIGPFYGVWAAEMHGKAQLAEAEYGKQVAVQTAKAKADSAQYEAASEVTRAEGVAKANKIIGDSLKDNEQYLRYLWVNGLNERAGEREVIYVPTEAGIPIMEAGRAVTSK